MRRAYIPALLAAAAVPAALRAVPAAADPAGLPPGLADALRGVLLASVPTPLYENHDHWDRQKDGRHGPKNDGLWWRVRVTAPDLAHSLVFQMRDVRRADPERLTFTAFIAFDTDIDYERQRWKGGKRLLSTEIRGRARVNLTLRCEVTSRYEGQGKLVPEAVFRVRVTASDFRYDDVVFEHVAGVGGDAAKLIGDAARASLKVWRPSLERRLVERANAAIVKAGDTKEVRLGLGKLFERK